MIPDPIQRKIKGLAPQCTRILDMSEKLRQRNVSPFEDVQTRAIFIADAIKLADELDLIIAQLSGFVDPEF